MNIAPAQPGDDAAIRRLLERPMGGAVRVALQRNPNASLAAATEGDPHHTLVGRDRNGDVFGVATRSVRTVWVDGRPQRLGYLGGLRLRTGIGGRLRLMCESFAALDATRGADELPYDLTSIAADNTVARRLLTRGLPGLPRYAPAGEIQTLIISTRRHPPGVGGALRRGGPADAASAAAFLSESLKRYRFAPVWHEQDLRSTTTTRGLEPDDFLFAESGGRIEGCVALWDQRGFKQAVVRGYDPRVARWRPAVNAWLGLRRAPRLPAPGSALSIAHASHLALREPNPALAATLIDGARRAAHARGIDAIATGFSPANPLLPEIKRLFRPRVYRTLLYTVHHRGETPPHPTDHTIPHPEVAVL